MEKPPIPIPNTSTGKRPISASPELHLLFLIPETPPVHQTSNSSHERFFDKAAQYSHPELVLVMLLSVTAQHHPQRRIQDPPFQQHRQHHTLIPFTSPRSSIPF